MLQIKLYFIIIFFSTAYNYIFKDTEQCYNDWSIEGLIAQSSNNENDAQIIL